MKHTITLLGPLMSVLRDEGEVSIPSWVGGTLATGDMCMIFIDGVPTRCVRTEVGVRLAPPVISLTYTTQLALQRNGRAHLLNWVPSTIEVGQACAVRIDDTLVECVRTDEGLRLASHPLTVSLSRNMQLALRKNGRVRLSAWDPQSIEVGDACAVRIDGALLDCVRTPEGLRLKNFDKKGPKMTLNEAIAIARTCLHAAQGRKITSEVDGEMLIDANMADAYDVLARWHSLLDGRGVMLLKSFRRDVAPTGTPVDLHPAVTTARGALAAGQGKAVPDGISAPDMEAAYSTLAAWHPALDGVGTQILRSFSNVNDLDDDDS